MSRLSYCHHQVHFHIYLIQTVGCKIDPTNINFNNFGFMAWGVFHF